MPNGVAYLMLGLWPIVALVLWSRRDGARALIWTILGGYLLLPPVQAAFQPPGVPDLNKVTIPNIMALVGALFLRGDRISFMLKGATGKLLIVLFVLSPFATVLGNTDPITGPGHYIPGMRIYDSVSAITSQAISLLPFFLARRYLGTPEAMRALAVALASAGLLYSLPMLVEARLSPQVNIWVYGFFQHDFGQTWRFGGYRPMVFLPHGLWLAFFVLMALVSAVLLARLSAPGARARWAAAALWLAVMLLLCRSFGPYAYALALVPLVLFTRSRTQILVAVALAGVVIAYPLLRGSQIVPVEEIANFAGSLSADRGDSFAYRVQNEDRLLAHLQERPWFGWGGYGRNLLHDMTTGQVLTVSDGMWIIRLGIYGWLGYIAEFGLLVLPLFLLAGRALRRGAAPQPLEVGTMALLLAVNLIDLLPNATLVPLTWLLAGAVLGHAEAKDAPAGADRSPLPAEVPARTIL